MNPEQAEAAIEKRDQVVFKALDFLMETIEEEISSTSDRLEACRIILHYDAQIFSTNADLLMDSEGTRDDDDEDEDG